MSDQKPDEDEAALQARLAKLNQALQAHDERKAQEEAPTAASRSGFGRAMSAGLNVFSEFVSAVVVGALIGWQGDAWFGTKPWLLVLFLGLGTAAGFWNIYRMAARKASSGEES
ncbi:MAG: AtpZ/AtpI family protein [Methylocystis sp.]|jgi:ATP synthase protein I